MQTRLCRLIQISNRIPQTKRQRAEKSSQQLDLCDSKIIFLITSASHYTTYTNVNCRNEHIHSPQESGGHRHIDMTHEQWHKPYKMTKNNQKTVTIKSTHRMYKYQSFTFKPSA